MDANKTVKRWISNVRNKIGHSMGVTVRFLFQKTRPIHPYVYPYFKRFHWKGSPRHYFRQNWLPVLYSIFVLTLIFAFLSSFLIRRESVEVAISHNRSLLEQNREAIKRFIRPYTTDLSSQSLNQITEVYRPQLLAYQQTLSQVRTLANQFEKVPRTYQSYQLELQNYQQQLVKQVQAYGDYTSFVLCTIDIYIQNQTKITNVDQYFQNLNQQTDFDFGKLATELETQANEVQNVINAISNTKYCFQNVRVSSTVLEPQFQALLTYYQAYLQAIQSLREGVVNNDVNKFGLAREGFENLKSYQGSVKEYQTHLVSVYNNVQKDLEPINKATLAQQQEFEQEERHVREQYWI